MLRITVTGKEREGEDSLSGLDAAAYSKAMFGMFGGEKVPVVIEVENQFVGVLIDRFGKDITISKTDDNHFRTTIDVVPSEIFIGWVMSFGEGMRIVGPDEVVQTTRQLVERLHKIYCEESQ